MKKIIRNILHEENKNSRLLSDMIENEGLLMTCKKVGGIERLSKILGVRDYKIVENYFVGRQISTNNFEFPLEVGGYDFVFEVTHVNYDLTYDFMEIRFKIVEGEVTLIMTTDETYDLLGDDLKENEYLVWEIRYEVREVVREYFKLYFEYIRYRLFSGLDVEVTNM
jgi:hypothetical protein